MARWLAGCRVGGQEVVEAGNGGLSGLGVGGRGGGTAGEGPGGGPIGGTDGGELLFFNQGVQGEVDRGEGGGGCLGKGLGVDRPGEDALVRLERQTIGDHPEANALGARRSVEGQLNVGARRRRTAFGRILGQLSQPRCARGDAQGVASLEGAEEGLSEEKAILLRASECVWEVGVEVGVLGGCGPSHAAEEVCRGSGEETRHCGGWGRDLAPQESLRVSVGRREGAISQRGGGGGGASVRRRGRAAGAAVAAVGGDLGRSGMRAAGGSSQGQICRAEARGKVARGRDERGRDSRSLGGQRGAAGAAAGAAAGVLPRVPAEKKVE